MLVSFDPAIINMSYCKVDIKTSRIKEWGIFAIKDSTNEGTCKKLYTELERLSLTDNEHDNIIVYEQQPRCNVKTISIAGQLQMYYTIKGTNIKKIVGYHAKHKIKYHTPGTDDDIPMPANIIKLKTGHYKTKKILVEICKRVLLINEETEYLEWFNKQKKKDDLADSYIQALSYIRMNKLNKDVST